MAEEEGFEPTYLAEPVFKTGEPPLLDSSLKGRLVIIRAVFLVTYRNVLRNLRLTTFTIARFNPLQLIEDTYLMSEIWDLNPHYFNLEG